MCKKIPKKAGSIKTVQIEKSVWKHEPLERGTGEKKCQKNIKKMSRKYILVNREL